MEGGVYRRSIIRSAGNSWTNKFLWRTATRKRFDVVSPAFCNETRLQADETAPYFLTFSRRDASPGLSYYARVRADVARRIFAFSRFQIIRWWIIPVVVPRRVRGSFLSVATHGDTDCSLSISSSFAPSRRSMNRKPRRVPHQLFKNNERRSGDEARGGPGSDALPYCHRSTSCPRDLQPTIEAFLLLDELGDAVLGNFENRCRLIDALSALEFFQISDVQDLDSKFFIYISKGICSSKTNSASIYISIPVS